MVSELSAYIEAKIRGIENDEVASDDEGEAGDGLAVPIGGGGLAVEHGQDEAHGAALPPPNAAEAQEELIQPVGGEGPNAAGDLLQQEARDDQQLADMLFYHNVDDYSEDNDLDYQDAIWGAQFEDDEEEQIEMDDDDDDEAGEVEEEDEDDDDNEEDNDNDYAEARRDFDGD